MVEAIILAGSPQKEKRLIGGKNKFFAKIGDTILGQIVINASAESDIISSIYISGDKSELKEIPFHEKVCKIIQEKGNFYANAIDAFRYTTNCDDLEKKVLYIACDIPFLNSKSIEDFISNAPEADLVYPYCLKEDFEKLFPQFKWPYQVSKEGQTKWGNIVLVKPNKVINKRMINKLFKVRKIAVSDRRIEEFANIPRVVFIALKLFGIEGLEIVVRAAYLKYFATPLKIKTKAAHHLSLDRIAKFYSKILGCDVKTVRTRFPELCFDIDNEAKELKYSIQNYEAIKQRIYSR